MTKPKGDKARRPLLWLQILIVAVTLAAIAAVFLLGRQSYRETRRMATEQFNRQQLMLARSAAANIGVYFGELSAELSSLATLPSIQQLTPECLKAMQHAYEDFPSRTSVRLLDRDGILRFIYPFDGWRAELIGRNYSNRAFFRTARETGRISVSGLVTNEEGDLRIRIAAPLYRTHTTKTVRIGNMTGIVVSPLEESRPESGRVRGVLLGSLDPCSTAQALISPIVSGETGYAWLLDDNGVFVAHHEEAFACRNAFEVRAERNPEVSYTAVEQIQRRMMAGEEGMGRYVSGCHRGQQGQIEKLVAYTPVRVGARTWSLAVCAPASEVEETVHKAQRGQLHALGSVTLVLIAGAISLLMMSHRWSHSLELEVARRTRELRETSDHLSNLIRYANAPIIVWDPDRRITVFNEAFAKMTGWTEAEMLGRPLDVLFPEESRADSLRKIGDASRGEYWETVAIPILCKDGEVRLALWNSANIYSEDGRTLIATIAQGRDITEQRELEAQLLQAQKMEAIGRLAGGVAHDFNNLLTVIMAHTEFLLGRLGERDPMRAQIEQIKEAADRATSLTRQLLAFSRRQVLQPTVLNINTVIADMDKMLRRIIGEDIRLITRPDPEIGSVKADRGQLEQVIMNLAVNARDAMPTGGTLIIESANVELDEAYTREHVGVAPGPYVMLAVSDSGSGMGEETLSRVFEPFFTTKDVGTGLGLSTVYGIVKQSGGHVAVYSEPGQGTTFKIYLPRVAEPEEAAEAAQAPAESLRGSETILLVEDDAAVRALTRGILEQNGYHVLEAPDPERALLACEQHAGPVHLMLTDAVLPQMSGRELAERLKPTQPEMKVLYMSGYTDDAILHHGILEQGTAFIQKPFTPDGLARKVRAVLDAPEQGTQS